MTLDNVQLHLIDSFDEVLALRSWLGDRRPLNALGLDTETSGLSRTRDRDQHSSQRGEVIRVSQKVWSDRCHNRLN